MEKDNHQKSVGIIGTGTVLYEAMAAAKTLNAEDIGASVMNIATIKPLDTDAVAAFAASHDMIAVVEEHQAAGGLGSAVAEYLSSTKPTRIVRIGVEDRFGQSGTQDELLEHYGLNAKTIVARVTKEFSL